MKHFVFQNLDFFNKKIMYIYKPDRILMARQIKKYGHYIKGKVLDVGAGRNKRYTSYFKYDKYITLDINPEANPDILASADKIPLENNAIDSIVCTQLLGDVTDALSVLKEFYRVLKPGGMVLLTESFINEMHDEPIDFWRFTKFGLKHLFLSAGFKVILIDQRGGFFSTKAQNNIRYLIDKFNLYSHQWARIFNPFFRIYSWIMFFLDKKDKSQANRKFALGWCIIARK